MATINRKFKDSLFRMIFRGKEELLNLYNAVNGSKYTNTDDLEINTLEDVVYMGIKNDVSFLFAHTVNLYEAQSSYNPNMPLRGIIYFGDVLKSFVETNHLDIYSGRQLKLPVPRFIVFYNGLKEEPERKILKLSDSFERECDEETALECTAVMLNINYGCNRELMDKCRELHDYSLFIDSVRKGVHEGKSVEKSVDDAILFALEDGTVKNLLKKNRAEVKRMVLTEYNEELHLKTIREEEREKFILEFIKILIKKAKKSQSLETAADALEIDARALKGIYTVVQQAAPKYDLEKIYEIVEKNKLMPEIQ